MQGIMLYPPKARIVPSLPLVSPDLLIVIHGGLEFAVQGFSYSKTFKDGLDAPGYARKPTLVQEQWKSINSFDGTKSGTS